MKKQIKHGKSGTPIYQAWATMIARCHNEKSAKYKVYGTRGIKVCERWHKFHNFYEDMGDRPTPKHSIDRIDNNKGYYKENCRWSTARRQSWNKQNSRTLVGTQKAKNQFSSRAVVNGHTYYIGLFKTELEAHEAYLGFLLSNDLEF